MLPALPNHAGRIARAPSQLPSASTGNFEQCKQATKICVPMRKADAGNSFMASLCFTLRLCLWRWGCFLRKCDKVENHVIKNSTGNILLQISKLSFKSG